MQFPHPARTPQSEQSGGARSEDLKNEFPLRIFQSLVFWVQYFLSILGTIFFGVGTTAFFWYSILVQLWKSSFFVG